MYKVEWFCSFSAIRKFKIGVWNISLDKVFCNLILLLEGRRSSMIELSKQNEEGEQKMNISNIYF